MSALAALAAAKAAGVKLILDGDGIIIDPTPSSDVVELLRAVKPDLMRILECREAARAALMSAPPGGDIGFVRGDYGIRVNRWQIVIDGLRRFVSEGWGDQAALLGWTKEELYRVPALWSQIWLTGAALMIGDKKVIAVTEDNIVIETPAGSTLRFRRIGREHVA
jgi:hypothetical protein